MNDLTTMLFAANRCFGVTKTGIQCKVKVMCGVYCNKHIDQETRPDWNDIPMVIHSPPVCITRKFVPKEHYQNQEDLRNRLVALTRMGNNSNELYFQRLSFLGICETMLYNRNLIIHNREFDPFVEHVLERMKMEQHLVEYGIHFKKSLSYHYRAQFQRKYVVFFFTGTELGPDLANYIANFI